jgi:hypothetical protein
MTLGVLEIRGHWAGFFIFGFSNPKQLWWTPEEGGSRVALHHREAAKANLCNNCKTLVVLPERAT